MNDRNNMKVIEFSASNFRLNLLKSYVSFNLTNLQIWNEFISLSDDEQEKIINDLDNKQIKKNYKNPKHHSKRNSPHFEDEKNNQSKRPIHNAKKCFDRIDGCLKSVLRRKYVALSFIDSIENDLVLYFKEFKEDPKVVYQICLDSSFERLCLHALAQYYGLNCQSI